MVAVKPKLIALRIRYTTKAMVQDANDEIPYKVSYGTRPILQGW